MTFRAAILGLLLLPLGSSGALAPFLEKNCVECHDAETKKGGLDMTALKPDLQDPKSFAAWVKIHDRTANGEMPPKKKPRPDAAQQTAYLGDLSGLLLRQDAAHIAAQGRTVERRMNRFEYENAVRDLLQAPWLDLKEILPEDTEAFRFNKTGQALPYFFDEVLALRVEKDGEGVTQRALMCDSDGLWLAKDRSGKLEAWEAPDLGGIIAKIQGGK